MSGREKDRVGVLIFSEIESRSAAAVLFCHSTIIQYPAAGHPKSLDACICSVCHYSITLIVSAVHGNYGNFAASSLPKLTI